MIYQVKLTTFAYNAARKLNPEIKKSARTALNELADNPFLGKELQSELSGFRSHRFMRYRIIYKVADQEKIITIYMVSHRRDVYELFSEYVKAKK